MKRRLWVWLFVERYWFEVFYFDNDSVDDIASYFREAGYCTCRTKGVS